HGPGLPAAHGRRAAPLVARASEEARADATGVRRQGQAAGEIAMARVLVVDDEYAIVETIVDVLEGEGYESSSASNGREAIERARETRPDLIIMDSMMPVMDGSEAYREMSRDPELASIPVVLMSAAPASTVTAP